MNLVPMRWMNIEPIIQSELRKRKNISRILTHIYGIYKDDTDESICRATVETQKQNKLKDSWGKGRGWGELREKRRNIYITICKMDSQ